MNIPIKSKAGFKAKLLYLSCSIASRMKRLLLLLTFAVSLRGYAQPAFIKDSLDSYIKQGMKDWQVPALSIVIVKDGRIVLMKGYGVRDITKNEPVDENTLFFIASNTKLFTGIALANLEHRNKLTLNDRITGFQVIR